jgi:hypothetical protein
MKTRKAVATPFWRVGPHNKRGLALMAKEPLT